MIRNYSTYCSFRNWSLFLEMAVAVSVNRIKIGGLRNILQKCQNGYRMKKIFATHFVFAAALFILISVYRDWLSLSYYSFWWGAVLGIILPYADYLIYVYLLKPKDAVSQEAVAMISKKKISKTADMLVSSFGTRKGLLMHNASFQALFLVFSIWIITSGNLLGMGLVLAFMLHLILDQMTDFIEKGNIDNWFDGFPVNLDKQQRLWYLAANVVIFLYLGFFF